MVKKMILVEWPLGHGRGVLIDVHDGMYDMNDKHAIDTVLCILLEGFLIARTEPRTDRLGWNTTY